MSELLKLPVIGTIAKKKKTLNSLLDKIINISENKIDSSSQEFIDKIINNKLPENFVVDIINKLSQLKYVVKYAHTKKASIIHLTEKLIKF